MARIDFDAVLRTEYNAIAGRRRRLHGHDGGTEGGANRPPAHLGASDEAGAPRSREVPGPTSPDDEGAERRRVQEELASGPIARVFAAAKEKALGIGRRAARVLGLTRAKAGPAVPERRRERPPVPRDLAGLALSGGGVRSASFCMGALQALHKHGLFERMDYLSTVSGGGYVGASVTADYGRRALDEVPCSSGGHFPLAVAPGRGEGLHGDGPLVAHIRDHGRYLVPHGFPDFVKSMAIILRGLVVNAVIVAAATLLVAIALIFAYRPVIGEVPVPGRGLLVPPLASEAPTVAKRICEPLLSALPRLGAVPEPVATCAQPLGLWASFPMTAYLAGACALVCLVWAVSRSLLEGRNADGDRFDEPGSWLTALTSRLLVATVVICALEAVAPVMNHLVLPGLRGTFSDVLVVAAPAMAGTGLASFFWRRLAGAIAEARTDPRWSSTVKALTAKLILLLTAAVVPLVLTVVCLKVVQMGLLNDRPSWWPAPTQGTLAWLAALPGGLVAVAMIAGIRRIGVRRLLGGGLFAAVSVGLAFRLRSTGTEETVSVFVVLCGLGAVLNVVAYLFAPNANSLHRLYRDRLAVAFNLGSRDLAAAGGAVRSAGDSRLKLSDLARADGAAPQGPLPILNAAVNLPGSAAVNRRGRNADFLTFSPYHVGSEATGYVPTRRMEVAERQLDLATAVAISGAAVSSSMGRVGVPMLAFTRAILNARLGFWLRNPAFLVDRGWGGARLRRIAVRAASILAGGKATEDRVLALAAGLRDLRLSYLWLEMFNRLDETRARIYVTDGGHIENLGLYQLLKRRCAFVVVVDGEADSGLDCGALVDAERFARIDDGIRIELPWEAIRDAGRARRSAQVKGEPPAPGPKTAHAAVGRILYSDERQPEEGVILYVKASLTGDENDYVLDYARRHPEFPHEATLDQFFSEEQMEAYRALGFHAMDHALSQAADAGQTALLNRLRSALGATSDPAVVAGPPTPAPARRSWAARPAPVPRRDRSGR